MPNRKKLENLITISEDARKGPLAIACCASINSDIRAFEIFLDIVKAKNKEKPIDAIIIAGDLIDAVFYSTKKIIPVEYSYSLVSENEMSGELATYIQLENELTALSLQNPIKSPLELAHYVKSSNLFGFRDHSLAERYIELYAIAKSRLQNSGGESTTKESTEINELLNEHEHKEFSSLHEIFSKSLENFKYRRLDDFCLAILQDSNGPREFKEKAGDYLALIGKAEIARSEIYMKIDSMLDDMRREFGISSFVVPGDKDGIEMKSIFNDKYLHMNNENGISLPSNLCIKQTIFNNISIAGYGGEEENLPWIPRLSKIPFNRQQMGAFLSKTDPDIAVVHTAPLKKEKGTFLPSDPLIKYAQAQAPYTIITGHDATPQIDRIRLSSYNEEEIFTYIINTGKLGRYGEKFCNGFFAMLNFDEDSELARADIYRINDYDAGTYTPVVSFCSGQE